MTDTEKVAIGVLTGVAAIFLIKHFARGTPVNIYDLNGDGRVDEADIALIEAHFGETGTPGWIPEDVNRDGVVDILDVVLVGQHFT